METFDVRHIITDCDGKRIGFNSSDCKPVSLHLLSDRAIDEAFVSIDGEQYGMMNADRHGDYSFDMDTKAFGIGFHSYHFEFSVSGKRYSFYEDGLSGRNEFGFLIYSSDFRTPDKFKGGIIYQIFPDRFCRSGKVPFLRNDAVLDPDWEHGIPEYGKKNGDKIKNNRFFGGDLYGICEKLDYLLSLGVNIIYLTPIFRAYSNHRYDTGDYDEIDGTLGGEEAFLTLISECKKRDILIILDGVFNHTGDDSKYFNKYGRYPGKGAYQSESSQYRDWYMFSDEYDCGYESWWGISILPRIRSGCTGFRSMICGDTEKQTKGILRKYLDMGISGWRLDVADELTDDFIKDIRKSIKTSDEEAILYGEVWEDASRKVSYGKMREYLWGYSLDSVMNYPLRRAIIDYLLSGSSRIIADTMDMLQTHYPKCVLDTLMNFLGTHDTGRIMTLLAGSPCEGMPNDYKANAKLTIDQRVLAKKRLTLAVCLIMTLPGIPMIYYGDEAGAEGYGDPFNRMPFPWGQEDVEVMGCFRRFAAARLSSTVFKDGSYRELNAFDGIFAFERSDDNESVIVALNAGNGFYTMAVPYPCVSLLTGAVYEKELLLLPTTCDILRKK